MKQILDMEHAHLSVILFPLFPIIIFVKWVFSPGFYHHLPSLIKLFKVNKWLSWHAQENPDTNAVRVVDLHLFQPETQVPTVDKGFSAVQRLMVILKSDCLNYFLVSFSVMSFWFWFIRNIKFSWWAMSKTLDTDIFFISLSFGVVNFLLWITNPPYRRGLGKGNKCYQRFTWRIIYYTGLS